MVEECTREEKTRSSTDHTECVGWIQWEEEGIWGELCCFESKAWPVSVCYRYMLDVSVWILVAYCNVILILHHTHSGNVLLPSSSWLSYIRRPRLIYLLLLLTVPSTLSSTSTHFDTACQADSCEFLFVLLSSFRWAWRFTRDHESLL